MTVIDLNARRLERLLAAVEHTERWAEQEGEHSHADPVWRQRREYVASHDDFTAESHRLRLHELEGAESAYADTAARLASFRAQLAREGAARSRFEAIVDELHGELAWADAAREEALAAQGAAIEPEQLHAKGRAMALAAIRVELRNLIDAAPWGTP